MGSLDLDSRAQVQRQDVASEEASTGTVQESAKLPHVIPAENTIVMDRVHQLKQEYLDAKELLALSNDPEAFDKKRAEIEQRNSRQQTPEEAETVTVGLVEVDEEALEAAREREKERAERNLAEKFWDKLSGWSHFDHTERVTIEDVYSAGKEAVTTTAEVLDDATGNTVSSAVNSPIEKLQELIKAEPDPNAREKCALILKANARHALKKIVRAFERAGPFGMKAMTLPIEMQKIATATAMLQLLSPEDWSKVEGDYKLFQEATKRKTREDFERYGYRVPSNMSAFTDQYLAAELDLFDSPHSLRLDRLHQLEGQLETIGAAKLDAVMTHYQAMKQLLFGRRRFEIEIADAQNAAETGTAYQRFWENIESFKGALPGYLEESALRGLLFGTDSTGRLTSPTSVAAFQLLAEKAARSDNSSISEQTLQRLSSGLGEELSDAQKELLGESQTAALSGLWSPQASIQTFGKAVSEMTDAELERSLEDLRNGEYDAYRRARSSFEHLRADLVSYDSLAQTVTAIKLPSLTPPLAEALVGSVERSSDTDENGETVERISALPKFDNFLRSYDAALGRVEDSLRLNLHAAPEQIHLYFQEYLGANEFEESLSNQAKANVLLFRQTYQSIAPQLALPKQQAQAPTAEQ